jgi:hypothetical protein
VNVISKYITQKRLQILRIKAESGLVTIKLFLVGIKELLTQRRLRELVLYNSKTGVVTARVTSGYHDRWKKGRILGTEHIGPTGVYLRTRIDGKLYCLHQLIWLYMYGYITEVDHRDRDSLNNRKSNLRECTRSQNLGNRKKHRDNMSGYKGVYLYRGRWVASIGYQRKVYWLGAHDTALKAHQAYVTKAKELFGDFWYGG